MPREMLAEDKHWSPWYFFSYYLIAQNTHPHTHTIHLLGALTVITNSHTVLQKQLLHNRYTAAHTHAQKHTLKQGHGFSPAPEVLASANVAFRNLNLLCLNCL